jgi:fatty acid desaturase
MSEAKAFPIKEAREIARRFAAPDPRIYWTDFFLSASLGWAAFVLAVRASPFSAAQFALVVVAALALYRAVIFTHELAHLKKGTFGAFRFVWNVVCGVPFMAPSFTYTGVHIDHHRRGVYGMKADGEYIGFATGKPWRIIGYVAQIFALPLLLAFRFIVLTPLSYFIPPLRRFVWRTGSSLAIDLSYQRNPPGEDDDATWRQQEFAAFAFGAGVIGLIAFGVLPVSVFGVWYAVAVVIFLLNSLRTLAAHAYRNPGDRTMTQAEEFLDSVNIPGIPFFSALWAPVGLRFHATHHLFPATPYHQLPRLHRALLAELPDATLYRAAGRKSLFSALAALWREAAAAERARRTPVAAVRSGA